MRTPSPRPPLHSFFPPRSAALLLAAALAFTAGAGCRDDKDANGTSASDPSASVSASVPEEPTRMPDTAPGSEEPAPSSRPVPDSGSADSSSERSELPGTTSGERTESGNPPPETGSAAEIRAAFVPATGSVLTERLRTTFDASTTVDPGGTSLSFSWTFVEQSGETVRNAGVRVQHSFLEVGTARAILDVSSSDGRTARAEASFTIEAMPDLGEALVEGFVTDTDGAPLDRVFVRLGLFATTVTRADGYYSVFAPRGVPLTLEFQGAGYATGLASLLVPADVAATRVDQVLVRRADPLILDDPESGGTVTGEGGAAVTIPAGVLVFNDGTPVLEPVGIYLTPLDYGTAYGFDAFPLGPEAIDAAGANVWLESFGVVELAMEASGREVTFAPGSEGQISIPITSSNDWLAVGARVPVWLADPVTGQWVETDTGQVEQGAGGGRVFVAPIAAAGWWNCDVGVRPIVRPATVTIRAENGSVERYSGCLRGAVTFPVAQGRGRMRAVGVACTDEDGIAPISVPETGAFLVQAETIDGDAEAELAVEADGDSFVYTIELSRFPAPILLDADADETFTLAAGERVVLALDVTGTRPWHVVETLPAGSRLERRSHGGSPSWEWRPLPESTSFTRTHFPEIGVGTTRHVWSYRAAAAATVRVRVLSPEFVEGGLNEELIFDATPAGATVRFQAPAGTWVRAVAELPSGGTPPSLQVFDTRGSQRGGIGSRLGDTGAVRLPFGGIQELRLNGFPAGTSTVRVRIQEVEPPSFATARPGEQRLVTLDTPGTASLLLVPLAEGDAVEVVWNEADPDSPTGATLRTAFPARNAQTGLLDFGSLLEAELPTAADMAVPDSLPARSLRRATTAQRGRPLLIYTALPGFTTGDVELRLGAASSATHHRVAVRSDDCADVTTLSLAAAGTALQAGGTIEVCQGTHDSTTGAIFPSDGTLMGLAGARPVLTRWPTVGGAWRFAQTFPQPQDEITLRDLVFQTEDRGSGIALTWSSGTVQVRIENVDVLANPDAPPLGFGSTGISVQGAAGSASTVTVDGVNVTGGHFVGIDVQQHQQVTISGSTAEGRQHALTAPRNGEVQIEGCVLEAGQSPLSINHTSSGNVTIRNNLVAQRNLQGVAATNAIFIFAQAPEADLLEVAGNDVLIESAGEGIVVTAHPSATLHLGANRVVGAGATGTVGTGISIRDPGAAAGLLGPVEVVNNVVRAVTQTGIGIAGVSAMERVEIVHNTVVGGGAFGSSAVLLRLASRAPVEPADLPVTVQSNLLIGGGSNRDVGVGLSSAEVSFTARTNAGFNLVRRYGLLASSTAHPVEPDADVSIDDTEFALDDEDAPPAEWEGLEAAAVNALTPPEDIDGAPRPRGDGPSIGAVER